MRGKASEPVAPQHPRPVPQIATPFQNNVRHNTAGAEPAELDYNPGEAGDDPRRLFEGGPKGAHMERNGVQAPTEPPPFKLGDQGGPRPQF